jgi:hypothetical protein
MRRIKFPNYTSVSRLLPSLAVVTLIVAVSSWSSSAQVLLTVDDTDVSNVVITANSSFAGQASSTTTANNGISLIGFFVSNETGVSGTIIPNSTLQGGGTGISYDDFAAINYAGGPPVSLDANLYVDHTDLGAQTVQNFTTASDAFTGTWTIDLSALGVSSAALPGNGATGSIFSGDANNPGVQIGTYDVVQTPEPTTAGLGLVGFAITGVAVLRRRRKAAKV